MRKLGADLGQADQRIAFEDQQHDVAVPGQHQEKADDRDLGQDDQRNAQRRAQHGDQARHADMGALQRRQRGAVISQPGELHRGDLVVPGERLARPAIDYAQHHHRRQAEQQQYGYSFQQALEQRARLVEPVQANAT